MALLLERMKAVAEASPGPSEAGAPGSGPRWCRPTIRPPRAHGAGDLAGHLPHRVPFRQWFVLPWISRCPSCRAPPVLTALIVVTMTWVVMPRLTRLLRGFLNPPRKG